MKTKNGSPSLSTFSPDVRICYYEYDDFCGRKYSLIPLLAMRQVKLCPDCAAEYFPHIGKCADCGTVLVWPEELGAAREKKKRLKEQTLERAVAVREGDLKWMNELYEVLIESGIPCGVHSDPGCKKGCCGDTCRLLVAPEDAERAQERIERYFMEVHPEVRAAQELASQGKCPACGSPVAADAAECADCGLPLLIIEE